MATFLSKLFKPKWQSANIETRKQALAQLDGNNADDHKTLLQLAEHDPSPEVQQTAIRKISDTQALIRLHKNGKDSLRPVLENRLYELASAQSLSIFDLIIDMDILSEMIIKATQAESVICGLARIEQSPVLLKIAMQARNAQIRQAAAELIETETELNQLFAHAKSKDKTVFQIARNKLSKLKNLAQEHLAVREKIEKLLADLENLNQTEALQHFAARLDHVLKQWPSLKALAKPAELERFEELAASCEAKRQKLSASEAAPQDKEDTGNTQASSTQANNNQSNNNQSNNNTDEDAAQKADELQSTLSTLHETLNRFRSQVARIQDISALDALVKTQENRWIEAGTDHEVSRAQERAYHDAMSQLRHYLQSLRSMKDHMEQITLLTQQLEQGLADEQQNEQLSTLLSVRKSLSQLISKVDWPVQFIKPAELAAAEQKLYESAILKQQQTEHQKQVERNVEQLLKELDQALEEKQIKQANTKLKALQAQLKSLGTQQSHKFQAALSLRIGQLNDLRDWHGFASTPKQVELCEAMERLAETHIDPMDKADKIKAMQQDWKSLGGTGDKTLWERFKSAADKAFEPCALFFAEQQQLKESNLKKREMLVEQLQSYLDSIDWQSVSSQASQPAWTQSDWKTADKINRQARQEWKDAFPIDFKAGKAVQQAFNKLIEQFDLHLETEKVFNLGRKQAIVDQAKALLEEANIQQAIQQVKSLQEAWQQVGITHHKADRQLWTEYRKICDEVFARREQARETQRHEINQAINSAEQICSDIEASLSTLHAQTNEQLTTLASTHRKRLAALPHMPSGEQEKFTRRIEQVLASINQELARREQQQRVNSWQEVARKAALIRQAYAEVRANQQPLPPAKQDAQDQQFQSQQPLPDALQNMLDSTWQKVKEAQLDLLELINIEQARALCIRCEIAAGLDSPEEDKALRMQLQVSRLSDGLTGALENLGPVEQLENALQQWYLALLPNEPELASLEQRIEKAKATLLS